MRMFAKGLRVLVEMWFDVGAAEVVTGHSDIAGLEGYRPANYNGKPCIVGECGYTFYNTTVASRSAREVQTAKDYVNPALNRGYTGGLVWTKDFTSDANRAAMEHWLKQFAGANIQLRPPALSFWAQLLALLGGHKR